MSKMEEIHLLNEMGKKSFEKMVWEEKNYFLLFGFSTSKPGIGSPALIGKCCRSKTAGQLENNQFLPKKNNLFDTSLCCDKLFALVLGEMMLTG